MAGMAGGSFAASTDSSKVLACATIRQRGRIVPVNRWPGPAGGGQNPAVSEALMAGLLAGYAIAVPVGPIAALIVGLTARTGLRVGVGAALGVATADGLYALAAVLGGAALARVFEPGGVSAPEGMGAGGIVAPLRWLAALVLIGLALRTARVALRRYRAPMEAVRGGPGLGTPLRAFLGLLGLTMLNPMTIVYFAALVVGRRAADGLNVAGEVGFVVAAFAASASWQLLLAGGGSLVGRLLTGARGRLATALVSSAVILGFAAWLLWPR
jgi:threonine/homoserine/homoserine lactone efflux protein